MWAVEVIGYKLNQKTTGTNNVYIDKESVMADTNKRDEIGYEIFKKHYSPLSYYRSDYKEEPNRMYFEMGFDAAERATVEKIVAWLRDGNYPGRKVYENIYENIGPLVADAIEKEFLGKC